jgi:hypothetical protein
MSFNVNFLGHVPYNPDNLHRPVNEKQDSKPPLIPQPSSGRLISFSLEQMMKIYWTVRSFKIKIAISILDTVRPLDIFLNAGGAGAGLLGASAGLAAVEQQLGDGNGFLGLEGYTKIFTKYHKKVRKSREGIIDGITQPLFGYPELKDTFLDLDPEIDPNRLESHIYRPNEGTLCSAGPVHIFQEKTATIVLDFSDVLYFSLRTRGPRLYWPKITIYIGVPGAAGAAFGNQIFGQVNEDTRTSSSNNFPPPAINLNFPGAVDNLGSTQISSQIRTTQIANVNIDIRPGDRCCDRFLWDGKDQDLQDPENKVFRENDVQTKTPKENSVDSCKDVCGDADSDPSKGLTGGVYLKRAKKEDEYSRPGGQL